MNETELRERIAELETALREIAEGSMETGRWLDSDGAECDPDDPGAEWEPYDEDEQAAWLETVTAIANRALKKARAA